MSTLLVTLQIQDDYGMITEIIYDRVTLGTIIHNPEAIERIIQSCKRRLERKRFDPPDKYSNEDRYDMIL